MHVTIQQTYNPVRSENISIIAEFVTSDSQCQSTSSMVGMFDLGLAMNCCPADSCSKNVVSLLALWIMENLPQQSNNSISIERLEYVL